MNVTVETLTPGDADPAYPEACVLRGVVREHDWVLLEHSRRYDWEMASMWYCRRCRRIDLMTTVGSKGPA